MLCHPVRETFTNRFSLKHVTFMARCLSTSRINYKHITLSLNNGFRMPLVGLGTWRASPEEIENAIDVALGCGYRHIDTAFVYNNEEAIGKTLKKWFDSNRIRREDLFVTSKLPHFGNRPEDVEKFLKLSLQRLQLNYLDLYLIHFPIAFYCNESILEAEKNEDGSNKIDFSNNNHKTWEKMELQVKNGLVRSIGLSNFNSNQVRKMYAASEIKPSVLQVELHAYLQQRDLVETCKELGIAITAYAPLGSPGATQHFASKYNYKIEEAPDLLNDPCVKEISKKYNKTTAQILLKYLIDSNIIVIPKSKNPARILENINIFDINLQPEDIKRLKELDKGEKGRMFRFPFWTGIESHPEFPFPNNQ